MGDEQMLSAVKLIGAGVLALLVVYGLIAMMLMLLLRIKDVFSPPKDYTPTRQRTKIGFLAIVFGAPVYLAGVCALELFPQFILYGLMSLGGVAVLLPAIAARGSEGRVRRYLSRPPFIDESRRAVDNSVEFNSARDGC
jgi:hypothetical protein